MPTPKSPPPSLFVPCSLSLKASRILAYVKINFVGNILTGFHANTWPRPKISLCETCRAKYTGERGTNGTADNSWFPAHSLLFFFAPFFFSCSFIHCFAAEWLRFCLFSAQSSATFCHINTKTHYQLPHPARPLLAAASFASLTFDSIML